MDWKTELDIGYKTAKNYIRRAYFWMFPTNKIEALYRYFNGLLILYAGYIVSIAVYSFSGFYDFVLENGPLVCAAYLFLACVLLSLPISLGECLRERIKYKLRYKEYRKYCHRPEASGYMKIDKYPSRIKIFFHIANCRWSDNPDGADATDMEMTILKDHTATCSMARYRIKEAWSGDWPYKLFTTLQKILEDDMDISFVERLPTLESYLEKLRLKMLESMAKALLEEDKKIKHFQKKGHW